MRFLGRFLALVLYALPASPAALYEVRTERVSIPMKDGVRLAATLFIPKGAPGEKFPPLLEYLPYRKDDFTAYGDERHNWFAQRGFAGARVDIRGTGRSEGHVPPREYSEQELSDGEEVIAWLARQPWSNGNVGMYGISWGGFNALQMAMRRPPALKAILAACATNDLFLNDVRFMDGIMHVDQYEMAIDLLNALPPSPEFPLDEKTLQERFDSPPWFLAYKQHQRDGAFWKEPEKQLERIEIPVFLIGGFYDGYRDSIPRMLEGLKTPVKAIVGPWNHVFPDGSTWEPRIDWRERAVAWWDRWLKGVQNGIMNEPKLAVYMRHWYSPGFGKPSIPGEWRAESGWPPKGASSAAFYLQPDHSLSSSHPSDATHQLKYVPSAGVEAGGTNLWWGELRDDLAPSDAFSLVYDWAPLTDEMAILGTPQVYLNASATAPLADWIARLSDVAPDGSVTFVTGAGLNGAQRDSSSEPVDLEPGRSYALKIALHFTSWVFPRGHRIRLSIANAQWPMMWPTPYSMTTALKLGGAQASRVELPVVPLESPIAPPKFAALPVSPASPPTDKWITERDQFHQSSRWIWRTPESSFDFPWGKVMRKHSIEFAVEDAHPESASAHGEGEIAVESAKRIIAWQYVFDLHGDRTNFYYSYTRTLLENGKAVRAKTWKEALPRDHQ
jgi:predicted acyl esterase